MSCRLAMMALALAMGVLLSSCAYMDFRRGAYESIRSRDASSQAASPGGVQRSMPNYDQYERERARLRGTATSDDPAQAAAPASAPASASAK